MLRFSLGFKLAGFAARSSEAVWATEIQRGNGKSKGLLWMLSKKRKLSLRINSLVDKSYSTFREARHWLRSPSTPAVQSLPMLDELIFP